MSLQEAAELYQTIPADRMNGIKGIGFRLEDGSIYDGTYELMTAGKMQTEFINEIPHYRDSPLVQQAIVDMEKILDKWKEKELTEPEKEKPLELEKTAEKAPKADIQTAKGKGKKQSVLQAVSYTHLDVYKRQEYLRTMSQFHNYSFNNTLLIAMQKPDATLVAGYQAWQKKFKRQVRRGEKAIQILSLIHI